jgi:hypothetical protein
MWAEVLALDVLSAFGDDAANARSAADSEEVLGRGGEVQAAGSCGGSWAGR